MSRLTAATRGVINWKRAAIAGLVAGLVFLILEMIMIPLFLGESPWALLRLSAAIVLVQGTLPQATTFNLRLVVAALVVHFDMSLVFGAVLALIIHRLSLTVAIIIGAIYGLVLYVVNFYVFAIIFPWLANARNWVTFFTHIVFGLVAASVYKTMVNDRVAS